MFLVRRVLLKDFGLTNFYHVRTFSDSMTASPVITFIELKKILSHNNNVVLLDVREKTELTMDGRIPRGKNIPLGEVPKAFQLDDDSFSKQYGFSKPKNNQSIIIHCKAGVRAQLAAKSLSNFGYKNLKVYSGIQDWKENGGETT